MDKGGGVMAWKVVALAVLLSMGSGFALSQDKTSAPSPKKKVTVQSQVRSRSVRKIESPRSRVRREDPVKRAGTQLKDSDKSIKSIQNDEDLFRR
jgi:hypothetical protein